MAVESVLYPKHKVKALLLNSSILSIAVSFCFDSFEQKTGYCNSSCPIKLYFKLYSSHVH